jgi:Xaa-Pro aminopeptidase
MFEKQTYIKRREKLKKTIGSGIILLLGNSESPMNFTDNTFHFRQDSTFLYFFGITRPDLVGLIDCDSGEELIYGNDYTVEDSVWMGPQPTIAIQGNQVGISKTATISQLINFLIKVSKVKGKIHFLPPYRAENKIRLFDWLGILPSNQQNASSTILIKAVINQRNYKSEKELTEITRAVNTSVNMHTLAMRLTKPSVTEAQIAAAVQEVAVAANGQISFPVIATINGEILHNHHHSQILKNGSCKWYIYISTTRHI